MSESLLRQSLCQAARELWTRGLIIGDGGILSAEVHRRRFLVTPVGLRRSDLGDADLAVVDIAGMDLVGGPTVPKDAWLPHRVAYRVGLDRESANGRGGEKLAAIVATVQATPPHMAALVRLSANATEIKLAGVPLIRIITQADEDTYRTAFESAQAVALRDSESIIVAASDLWQAVNLIELIEHAAAIELLCRRQS